MAKRKFDFKPSEYQEKIFDWIEHGVGNAVVSAYAGSGKTSTCVAAIKLIPKTQKCLFIAFNKSIAEELSNRLKNRSNVNVRTTHSLGLLMLKRNFGSDIEVDEYKYRKYLKKNISELTTAQENIRTQEDIIKYIDNTTQLINFSRLNLAQSDKEIAAVAAKYDIPVDYDECSVARKCLEWGQKNVATVDYTDMIWLPVELSLKPIGLTFDWVFFDEAQDASITSIQLFLKTLKRGGRFMAVGDENQAIYSFAGADEEAFGFLKNYQNTTMFQLPISYRCPNKVIRLAQDYVEDIKARTDAPDGIVVNNGHIRDIKDGDMVLARTKSPLIKLYTKLLRKNINCYIKGSDIATKMINTLENVKEEELNRDLTEDGVFVRLYNDLFNDRNKLIQTRGLDYDDATLSSYIMEEYDTIQTLYLLSSKLNTKTQLIEHIKEIFKEDSEGVCLSTIHKAKGLESDNVYILCRSSMPSRLAQHDWERIQENNLIYVAYTRAKEKLCFISEKEIPPTGSSDEPENIINDLAATERIVCGILNKEPMQRMNNVDLARFKLQNMTKIEDLSEEQNKVVVNDYITEKNDDDLLLELRNLL